MATPTTVSPGVARIFPPLKDKKYSWGVYYSHLTEIPEVETFRLDLTESRAVQRELAKIKPDAIVHAAGLTNVDACEENPTQAGRLHVHVSETVARAARATGAKLVHISTDHLSDGTKAFVDEESEPTPLNEYARTKLEAERAVMRICPDALIIRTNFFGWGTRVKASFSDWVLNGLRQGKTLPLFVDVFITPILINELKAIIEKLLDRGAEGVYNVVGRDRVSKYEFGVRLAKVFGFPVEGLRPVSVRDVALRAPRPRDMSLSSDKVSNLVDKPMPSLDESLKNLKVLEEFGWPQIIQQEVKLERDEGNL